MFHLLSGSGGGFLDCERLTLLAAVVQGLHLAAMLSPHYPGKAHQCHAEYTEAIA